MTWMEYIMPLRKSGISGDATYKILHNVFEQAGSAYDFSDETAKKWLRGERQCKASKYFPTGQADTDSLFRYFRNRPDDKLCRLQQIFREAGNLDTDSTIDVKTDDLNIFCWSLVNQFLDLLKFERVDIPQPSGDTTDIGTKPFLHEHKCCLYCIHWKCTASITEIFRGPLSGICHKYNGNRHSLSLCLSSTAACSDYKENENLNEQDERAWFQR